MEEKTFTLIVKDTSIGFDSKGFNSYEIMGILETVKQKIFEDMKKQNKKKK